MTTLILNLLLLIIGASILVRAATVLVKSISMISRFFKLSEFTTAFILMGLITSIPELSVAITSAVSGNPSLALGTALGSNLTDLTLIIAIPILVSGGISIKSVIARKDALYMAVYSIVPIFMLLDGVVSRTDGIILLIFYILYLYRLINQRSHFIDHTDHVGRKTAIKNGGVFALGMIALFASSQLIVMSSTTIATLINIPIVMIGLVIVSAGTSLPELAHGLKSVAMHHERQVIGDVLGSVVANSTIVIAMAAIITPITIFSMSELAITIVVFVIVLALFTFGVYSDRHLTIKEAVVLLGIYLLFIFSEFVLEIIQQSPWSR